MNTTRFQVFGLRGIDERWMTDGQDALIIEDMYITENDSWKSSGGFIQLYTPRSAAPTLVDVGMKATLLRGGGGSYSGGFHTTAFSTSTDRTSELYGSEEGERLTVPITITYSTGAVGDGDTSGSPPGTGGAPSDGISPEFDDIVPWTWTVDPDSVEAEYPPTERGDTDADGTPDYEDAADGGDYLGFATPDVDNPEEYESKYSSTFSSDLFYGTTEGGKRGYSEDSYMGGGGDGTPTVGSTTALTVPGVFYADYGSDYEEIQYGKDLGSFFWRLDDDGSPIPKGFYTSGEYGATGPADAGGYTVGSTGGSVSTLPTVSSWGEITYAVGTGAEFSTLMYYDLLPYGPNKMIRYWSGGGYTRFPTTSNYEAWVYRHDPFFKYMFNTVSLSEVAPGGSGGGGSDGGSDGVTVPFDVDELDERPDIFDPYDGIYDDGGGLWGEDDPEFPDTTTIFEDSVFENYRFDAINSIHWFAQHNGARQFLIYEKRNATIIDGIMTPTNQCTLKVFDGSKHKPFSESPSNNIPEKTLRQYSDPYTSPYGFGRINLIRRRTASDVSVRTQSQSYGGRLYMANGFDETIVFNGETVEKAGFVEKPPAPGVKSSGPDGSMTIPIAIGDSTSDYTIESWEGDDENAHVKFPKSKAFYGKHFEVPYFGLGVASDAEIGVGAYRVRRNDSADVYRPTDVYFTHDLQRRLHYYNNPQFDTRKCGYQYKISYVNERGQESSVSESSTVAIMHNGSNSSKNRCFHGKGSVAIDLPLGPKECVARRVYRTRNLYDVSGNLFTTGDQQSYYFLTEIQDNMTKVFMDSRPDTSLGELLDTRELGNFPNRTKFLAVFKNTMFCAGSELNEVRFSSPLMPETFPEENIISIGDDDGGQIMGMRATKNALVVFKQRGIYLVKGDPSVGFASFTLNKDIGCSAPDSIQELPGLGLAFLSQKSVYLLEGALENTGSPTGLQEIGIEISQTLELLNQSGLIRASGCVYQKDKEYWLSVPTNGSDKNDLCLIYHYEYGAWSIRRDFPIDCMVSTKDHRGYLMMGSNDVVNVNRAGILSYSRGSNMKGAITLTRATTWSAIPGGYSPTKLEVIKTKSLYKTVNVDYQSVFTTFRPAHVFVYSVGFGDNELLLNTTVNRSMFSTRSFDQESGQQDPNERYPVYSEAIFENDIWTAYRPIVNRFDITTSHEGPVRELSIQFASQNGHKIEIIGYDLEAKVGEQRNIKPLNAALRASRR